MRTYLQFRDYLNRRGLIYIHNPGRDSYEIYFKKSVLLTEISAMDARHNFDSVRQQIEMAIVLFGQ